MPGVPIIRNNPDNVPAIHGTRLTVYAIMDQYFAGDTMEQIAAIFKITIEEAGAAATYINEHLTELMPPYQRMLRRDREGDPPEVRSRYAESHARLMALKADMERKNLQGKADARIAG